MNNTRLAEYTPLESLFLFQLISKYGFLNGSFERIAQELRSNSLVFEQTQYDPGRLTPDALRQLALQLLSEEQSREAGAVAEKGANGLSPTSKKRKLQNPPLPTLEEAHAQPEKLPILVDRLYGRFRDDLVKQIREDEQLYLEREREIDEIERGEWDERIKHERRTNAASSGALDENAVRPPKPSGYATPTPAPIRAPVPVQPKIQEHVKPVEPPPISAPVTPPAAVIAPAAAPPPPPPPPAQAPLATPLAAPSIAGPATASTAPPPVPLSHATHGKIPLQPTSSPSPLMPATAVAIRPVGEQRHFTPDGRTPPEPARTPTGTTPVLQPPQMVPGCGPRPTSTMPQSPLHVTDGVQRPDNLPKSKSPVPGQPGQAQPPPALKWEPPYQPPHHPPHQTPVPSPRPPYTQAPSRPPIYSPHTQPIHSQVPQHMPQHAQHYTAGRQTPGQIVPQPQFSAPGTSAPSPPVLLPPQTAVQIPPPLQSMPVNTAPDGTGQHGSHQRPPSTPSISSSTSNVHRSTYAQHQTAVLPTSTPGRPPSGLAATHPAIVAAKSSSQPIQAPQLPSSARHLPQPHSHPHPQPPPQQLSVPSTPSQPKHPKSILRPYVPYGQQSKPPGSPADTAPRSHVPVQTPISTPQTSPSSSFTQVHTPSGGHDSSYVLRGHGTKWVSTPTPSTPRIKDVTNIENESPAYEPYSPPRQQAQLFKTFTSAESGTSRSAMGPDTTKARSRPPRALQKVEIAPNTGEAPVETDPLVAVVKNEGATPQALQEVVDTGANETASGTPTEANSFPNKRKRQDSPPARGPPTPATHVLWTRAFHKISTTALDQIIGHRYANMFANPIKPRLAPGYYDIILRPQDLKRIQKAITAGSKAAAAAVATLPDVEANAPVVWLPISVELVPPRGIINVAQLERELIHMFANAIMYNPDPQRGLGPSFLKSYHSNPEEAEDLRGYEFDENGVVKETRNMFAEVEKLLGDLRSEVVPRFQQAMGTGSRSVSAAVGELSAVEDDGDDPTGDAKRRRIRG
ncbi:hypothetical protein GGS21DRAFT_159320 [Xylaria nigripes]|nr:hypothetical protein GGS21DRAFT_159320 [Xylaria nigripes]